MKFVKLAHDSKKPPRGPLIVSDDPEVHGRWPQKGLLTGKPNNVMCVDIDDKNRARLFFRTWTSIIKSIVETRRGAHFYFRGSGPTRKTEMADIRGDGAYCVFPSSIVAEWEYHFVPGYEWTDNLELFPEELFPRKEVVSTHARDLRQSTKIVKDVRAYIRKIPSVSGEHGHDACFRVACILRDAGFSEMDALIEMLEWEKTCASPLWGPVALAKKIRDAYRVVLKGW